MMHRSLALLAVLALLPLALACGESSHDAEEYSGAFVRWVWESGGIQYELDQIEATANDPLALPDPSLASQASGLVSRQSELNQLLAEASVPAGQEKFHQQIVRAIESYEASVPRIPPSAGLGEARAAFTLAAQVQRALTNRVVSCYAQSTNCN